jgi:hypothetical protein
MIKSSVIFGTYENVVDRESAFEKLSQRAQENLKAAGAPAAGTSGGGGGGLFGDLGKMIFGSTGPRGGRNEGLLEKMAGSAVRTVGSSVGREIVRGILGGILGGGRRR